MHPREEVRADARQCAKVQQCRQWYRMESLGLTQQSGYAKISALISSHGAAFLQELCFG